MDAAGLVEGVAAARGLSRGVPSRLPWTLCGSTGGHADDVHVTDGGAPRLVIEKYVAFEASREEAAERLLFATRRILEEPEVRLE